MKTRNSIARPENLLRFIPVLLAVAVLFFAGTAYAAKGIVVEVTVGKSVVLTTENLKKVSITDPNVADVLAISQKEVQINGKKAGSTSMIVWDKAGNKTFFEISVNVDTLLLEERIKEIAPGDPVVVQAFQNTIIVKGSVSSQERYDRIDALLLSIGKTLRTTKTVSYLQGGQTLVSENLGSFGSETEGGPKFINMIEVIDIPQILLQITVASIDRKALKDLGINWSEIAKGVALFSTVGSSLPFSKITDLAPSGAAALKGDQSFANNPNFSIIDTHNGTAYMIRALSNKGLAKVLAEPNLIVKSGESGKFVAGGSFPIPVVQSTSSGTAPAITVVYQDFGVMLNFKPTAKETGVIQLKLDPAEVSALDFGNAVKLSGFDIPALKKDTVSTSVDLKDGESFLIAGLIRDDWAKSLQKFPLLGDIPILGAFFREQHMEKTERELVFLVTPKLVKPMVAGTKTELPGANEPSAAQSNDMRWFPMMPDSRTLDPEKIGK